MMKLVAIVLLGLVACSTALPRRGSRAVPGGGRIVGGEEATHGQFPYQLSLLNRGSHICGASIISETLAVTAAHCVEGDIPSGITLKAGAHDRTQNSGQDVIKTVVKIVVHENYDSPTNFANDIALLFLDPSSPLVYNNYIANVELPTLQEQTTGDIIVSGWGTTSSGGSLPRYLQFVQIPTVDDATCRTNYPQETIQESMLCAGRTEGGQDSCQGDSGGPLVSVASKKLVGIVSWGYGCAVAGKPGVNTEVSYFVDWIAEQKVKHGLEITV